MAHRIEQAEQLPGAIGVAERCERERGPHRGVRVLAAVFAHARHIALDVAGRRLRRIEGWGEQLDDPCVGMDEVAMKRFHGGARAFGRRRAGQHRPALRDRVDLAFRTGGRSQRGAVVEPGALVPVAVPRACFDALAQLPGFDFAQVGEGGVGVSARDRRESFQHRDQKEGQPDAFTLARRANQVHAVVPVARSHQRQSVLAIAQAMAYRQPAVIVEARLLVQHLG